LVRTVLHLVYKMVVGENLIRGGCN
jgi:hypothetical protein